MIVIGNRMAYKRKLLIIVVFIIVFTISYFSKDKSPQLCNGNIPDIKNIQSVKLPSYLECDACEEGYRLFDWKVSQEPLDTKYYNRYTKEITYTENAETTLVVFSDDYFAYTVVVILAEYDTCDSARSGFSNNDPTKSLRRSFWNFEYEPEKMIVESWEFENKYVDEEMVLCGNGDENNCERMFYLARSNNYFLWVYSSGAMDYHFFESIIQEIITQLYE